jgi:hypothetical protein
MAVVVLVVLASLIFTGLALAAQVAIDHFDEAPAGGTASTVTDAAGGGPTSGTSTGTTAIGERDVIVEATVGSGSLTFETVTEAAPSTYHYMHFLAGSDVEGIIEVQWDGNDGGSAVFNPTGLGGADLTDSGQNSRFHIEILGSSTPVLLRIEVYSSASNWSYYQFNLPVIPLGSHVDFSPRFGNFTQGGSGSANFANVGGVRIFVNSDVTNSVATDFRLDFFASTAFADFGDAPASYDLPTPASHSSDGLVRLGKNIDTEAGPNPSASADGDNLDQADDEDGITRFGNWTANGSINVEIQGAFQSNAIACLSAWIDYGDDGVFNPADKVLDREPITQIGVSQVTFPLSTSLANATVFARFRLMPEIITLNGNCADENPAIGPTGYQEYGEVEDYLWSFGPTQVTISSLEARSGVTRGIPLLMAVGVLGLVGGGLLLLARRRSA